MYERVAMGRIATRSPHRSTRRFGRRSGHLALTTFLLAAVVAPALARAQVPGVRIETTHIAGKTYLASMEDGGRAELTLDPRLQSSTEEVLRNFQIPYGAAVAISIPDGRVLALVGHSAVDPRLGPAELALRAWAPAASVFK